MTTTLAGWSFLFILLLGLVGCDVRPFSDLDGSDNNRDNRSTNNRPQPTAPNIRTDEDTSGTSQVNPNDRDTNQTHTFAVTTSPTNGTATVNAQGLVTYTPTDNFNGTDSLVITVTDSGNPSQSDTVAIAVTIAAKDDPPVPTAPPIVIPVDVEGISQVTPNDPDSGQTHHFEIEMEPSHGTATLIATTGRLTYQPNEKFIGRDEVQIVVRDDSMPPLEGRVTIEIRVFNPVTVADVENTTIELSSGGAFHPALAGEPITLTFRNFAGNMSQFTLQTRDAAQAEGLATVGDVCAFDVTLSSFQDGAGPLPGEITIDPCEVSLDRELMIVIAAQPAELSSRIFICPDATALGIMEANAELDMSGFVNDSGNFTLSSSGSSAIGEVMVSDTCRFRVTTSDFMPGQGPKKNDQFTFSRCEVDTVSGQLLAADDNTDRNLVCDLRKE